MYNFQAMNSNCLIAGVAEKDARNVQKWIGEMERRLSRFCSNSELTAINAAPGRYVPVSAEVYEVIQAAMEAYSETEGLFTPFLGNTLCSWGYDRSFEHIDRETAREVTGLPLTGNLLVTPFVNLATDLGRYSVCCSVGGALDLGGIAKGWLAQRAGEVLQNMGREAGLIDAGGDIVLWGKDPIHEVWGIGIANPFTMEDDIADLWFHSSASIATSSAIKRSWRLKGRKTAHHIIDPRIQQSAQSDLSQVTVICNELAWAEIYAKCVLILGSEAGLKWIGNKCPEAVCITVSSNGTIKVAGNMDRYCKEWEVRSSCYLYGT
jgi:thiamine biosynthesis lipoprotein